jgi:hypothetical protein
MTTNVILSQKHGVTKVDQQGARIFAFLVGILKHDVVVTDVTMKNLLFITE